MADRHVAVVGGGIAGLAAAHRLVGASPAVRVTLLEAEATPGGKLRTGSLAGRPCDAGAEAFLTGDPAGGPSAAFDLASAVGLGGPELVHPATGRAALAIGGSLVPMPAGTLMGVPADPAALDGLATVAGDDSDAGRPLLAPGADTTIGGLVRRRFGGDVVARLVDPMLGGVYAGNADAISLRMAVPALADAAAREHTLAGAVRAAVAGRRFAPGSPVFTTVVGGLGRLVGAVAHRLLGAGATIRTASPVTALRREAGGWLLSVAGGPAVTADAVVLAAPLPAAARLVGSLAAVPLEYASVALVTLALPAARLPELSGILVPSDQGYAVKAATFFDVKWAHLRRDDGIRSVRVSIGRHGDTAQLALGDAELVALARGELARLLDTPLPAPVDATVARWESSLPQYPAGHAARVAELRRGLDPTLALAGAGYDGIGIPLCVRSGQAAADAVLTAVLPRR